MSREVAVARPGGSALSHAGLDGIRGAIALGISRQKPRASDLRPRRGRRPDHAARQPGDDRLARRLRALRPPGGGQRNLRFDGWPALRLTQRRFRTSARSACGYANAARCNGVEGLDEALGWAARQCGRGPDRLLHIAVDEREASGPRTSGSHAARDRARPFAAGLAAR